MKFAKNSFIRKFYLAFKKDYYVTYIYPERSNISKFCNESETYVHTSLTYCTDIYSQSETYVYSNLPVPYLRNLTLCLNNKASINLYLGTVPILHSLVLIKGVYPTFSRDTWDNAQMLLISPINQKINQTLSSQGYSL